MVSGNEVINEVTIGAILPDKAHKINFSALGEAKGLAFGARSAADGYYGLIKNNFDLNEVELSAEKRFEMAIALAGLACEIYIKSLLYFEQSNEVVEQVRGHNLVDLFQQLSDRRKSEIERKTSDRYDFEEPFIDKLDKIKDVFEVYRYHYELSCFSVPARFLSSLLSVLHDVCHEDMR